MYTTTDTSLRLHPIEAIVYITVGGRGCMCRTVARTICIAFARRRWRKYCMALIIIAPEAPQPPPKITPPLTPRRSYEDPLDRKLVEAVNLPDNESVPIWSLVHGIVATERQAGRTERRRLVGRVLCRIRCLIRRQLIVRDGRGRVRLCEQSPVTPSTSSPSSKTPAPPVRNLPPAAHATVAELGNFSSGGSRGRVFTV